MLPPRCTDEDDVGKRYVRVAGAVGDYTADVSGLGKRGRSQKYSENSDAQEPFHNCSAFHKRLHLPAIYQNVKAEHLIRSSAQDETPT